MVTWPSVYTDGVNSWVAIDDFSELDIIHDITSMSWATLIANWIPYKLPVVFIEYPEFSVVNWFISTIFVKY